MPVYDRSPAEDVRVIDRWEAGVGWLAHPDETGRRASHAIRADDGVWIVDPLDAPGVDDLVDGLGEVAGVAVLNSYHARDAGAFATRYDVAVHVPRWMDRVEQRVDAPIERYERTPGDSGLRIYRFDPLPTWREAVAYRPADGTLIVPDLLGTGPGYTVGGERVGVVLSHRPVPPRETLGELDPERILFGHGEGVFEDASGALEDALDGARRRFPRALVEHLGTSLRSMTAAVTK